MATTKKEVPDDKKPKRRLRNNPETMRERQATVQADVAQKPSRVRAVLRPLAWPLRTLAGLKVWQATWFKPFRFTFKWVGLIFWPPYFRSSFRELQLVTWPNFRQSVRLTFAVLAFAAVLGAAITVLDLGLDKLFKEVLLK